MTPSRRLSSHGKIKQIVFVVIYLFISVPARSESVTGQSYCMSAYQNAGPFLRDLLGPTNDERLAPAIDRFILSYREHYRETPSYEAYMDRLSQNNFKGDRSGAYDLMQRLGREDDQKSFDKIIAALGSLEKLAGPLSAGGTPLDRGALDYAKCQREYMAKALRALPGNSYYDLKRSELLRRIEPAGNSDGQSGTGPDAVR